MSNSVNSNSINLFIYNGIHRARARVEDWNKVWLRKTSKQCRSFDGKLGHHSYIPNYLCILHFFLVTFKSVTQATFSLRTFCTALNSTGSGSIVMYSKVSIEGSNLSSAGQAFVLGIPHVLQLLTQFF